MYTHYCNKKIADMTDKELISEAKGLHCSIYVTECYGSKDMMLLMSFMDELNKRGYEVEEDTEINFVKT